MRVLIVNTSEKTGGAAVAASRLKDALNHNGIKAKMLVRDKLTDDITVVSLRKGWCTKWHFLWERFCVFFKLRFSRKYLFALDIANSGTDITSLREFKEADVIHLSWINQGMLSLSNIRKILRTGKPVVWTMHDLWPASAICHLSLGCNNFKTHCGHCKYLPNGGSSHDLSYQVWKKKEKLYNASNISFVACSRWLANEAKASGLLKNQVVTAIPNPINTQMFNPNDKRLARQLCGFPEGKRLILFVAQRATNVNKGMSYLIEACNQLTDTYPEMCDNTALVILGGQSDDFDGQFRMQMFPLGYVSDEAQIVNIYNAVAISQAVDEEQQHKVQETLDWFAAKMSVFSKEEQEAINACAIAFAERDQRAIPKVSIAVNAKCSQADLMSYASSAFFKIGKKRKGIARFLSIVLEAYFPGGEGFVYKKMPGAKGYQK